MTSPMSREELNDIKKKYESITTSCVSCNEDVSHLLDEVERLRAELEGNLNEWPISTALD